MSLSRVNNNNNSTSNYTAELSITNNTPGLRMIYGRVGKYGMGGGRRNYSGCLMTQRKHLKNYLVLLCMIGNYKIDDRLGVGRLWTRV